MNKPIWKSIPGYTNYEVSNFGQVRNVSGKVLKQFNSRKYKRVALGVGNQLLVHRIVYCTFYGVDIDTKLKILHKDDNPENNSLKNLFIGTQADNAKDKVMKNRQAKGCDFKSTKLNPEKVRSIRKLLQLGFGVVEIARKFTMCHASITKVKYGKTWAHVE